MVEFASSEISALIQVILIDLVLAGDNAIIVGMAAASVPVEYRRRVIFWGIGAAVILRIVFAVITVQLLQIIGLTLAGGLVLAWVCWKFYRELAPRQAEAAGAAALDDRGTESAEAGPGPVKSFRAAIWHVALADVSVPDDGESFGQIQIQEVPVWANSAMLGTARLLIVGSYTITLTKARYSVNQPGRSPW